jgi:predicted DNA-binding transcriptional regulator AlpA
MPTKPIQGDMSTTTDRPRGGMTAKTSNRLAFTAQDDAIVPELLTTRQAVQLAGIGERTLWRWSRSGIAPAPIIIGRTTVRYSRRTILGWIERGCPSADRDGKR